LIGMKPIADSDGDLDVFYVKRNDSELWLNSDWSNPGNVWNPGSQWVFRLPRNSLYFLPV